MSSQGAEQTAAAGKSETEALHFASSVHDDRAHEQIIASLAGIDKTLFEGNEKARADVLAAARSLVHRLETPWDRSAMMGWVEPIGSACVKTAVDTGLFRALAATSTPQTISQLAATTSTSPILLKRILRVLAAIESIHEIPPGDSAVEPSYTANDFSTALANTQASSFVRYLFETSLPVYAKIPEFLASTNYANPTSDLDTVFQAARGKDAAYWRWLSDNPQYGATFNELMVFASRGRPDWLATYPIAEIVDEYTAEQRGRVADGKDISRDVFLVDVGGGAGHDVEHLVRLHPGLPGRVVLQDKPEVIKDALEKRAWLSGELKIEPMEYDFFEVQPVTGARVYFLGSVLHDWPDPKGRQILARVREAMVPGWSTLLLHERALPEWGLDRLSAAVDLSMMSQFAAAERTESQWRDMLHECGFEVVRVMYSVPRTSGFRNVIEARVRAEG